MCVCVCSILVIEEDSRCFLQLIPPAQTISCCSADTAAAIVCPAGVLIKPQNKISNLSKSTWTRRDINKHTYLFYFPWQRISPAYTGSAGLTSTPPHGRRPTNINKWVKQREATNRVTAGLSRKRGGGAKRLGNLSLLCSTARW